STRAVAFGRSQTSDSAQRSRFNGSLADVAFYKRALSVADEQALQGQQHTPDEPGLAFWYNFAESSGTAVVNRAAGGGYAGTLVAGAARVVDSQNPTLLMPTVATDSDGSKTYYSATSNNTSVAVLVQGSVLFVTPATGFSGTARITVTTNEVSTSPYNT